MADGRAGPAEATRTGGTRGRGDRGRGGRGCGVVHPGQRGRPRADAQQGQPGQRVREAAARTTPQRQRGEHGKHPGPHSQTQVLQLEVLGGAPAALVQVLLHGPGAGGCEGAAGEGTQLRGVPLAVLQRLRGDVLLHVRGAQPFTGTFAQRGHGVRLHAHHRSHLTGPALLHLEVPQHLLPPLGEGGEGPGHHGGIHLAHHGVVEELHTVQRSVRLRVLRTRAGEVVGAVRGQPRHRRDHVGPEELARTLPLSKERQHPREGLGDQVLGVGVVAGVHAGHGQCGAAVAFVELAEGRGVPLAHGTEQLLVARGAGGLGRGTSGIRVCSVGHDSL